MKKMFWEALFRRKNSSNYDGGRLTTNPPVDGSLHQMKTWYNSGRLINNFLRTISLVSPVWSSVEMDKLIKKLPPIDKIRKIKYEINSEWHVMNFEIKQVLPDHSQKSSSLEFRADHVFSRNSANNYSVTLDSNALQESFFSIIRDQQFVFMNLKQ